MEEEWYRYKVGVVWLLLKCCSIGYYVVEGKVGRRGGGGLEGRVKPMNKPY